MFLNENSLHTIDWHNSDSHLFLNQKLPQKIRERMINAALKTQEKSHIFLATSGTSAITQKYKLVALHKDAFLNSANSVNLTFGITKNDIILNILPTFHVGGLSAWSRVHCAQAKIVNIWNEEKKWDPLEFVKECQAHKCTVTSLVPTQIFDICALKLNAPSFLSCVFVGGGALSFQVFKEAKKLGWPIYPTYGMTECCSQVATYVKTSPSSNHFQILPHVQLEQDESGCLKICGQSLLSYYIHFDNEQDWIEDPKKNGYFLTQDMGEIKNNFLQMNGRQDDHIKVHGELVNLLHIKHEFEEYLNNHQLYLEHHIVSQNNPRSGNELVGVFLNSDAKVLDQIKNVQRIYNQKVLLHERIHKIVFIENIPKTELGKVQVNKLKEMIQEL